MSREASYPIKLKKAVRMLFFKRHRQPGVKGWELKRELGNKFMDTIKVLNSQLEKLGLQVKVISEGAGSSKEHLEQDLDEARFIIRAKDSPDISDARMCGWRIDDIAALTVTIACLISRGGKMPRKEIEKILKDKFPRWRVKSNIEKFIKMGYLRQGEGNSLDLGWRSNAEVDKEKLLKLILGAELTKVVN